MATTKIEFAHETVNPLVGCSRVSPGCDHCYAARMAVRFGGNPTVPQYKGLATMTPNGPAWTGEVRYVPGVLEKAKARLSKARKPKRIFMVSMGDLFHDNVTTEWVSMVFSFMHTLPMHRFIVITKRPARMESFLRWFTDNYGLMAVLPNVMLMATCEDQQRAEERIPHLLKLAARGWHTGVIVEPMLEAVDLGRWMHRTLGWDKPDPVLQCVKCGATGWGKYFTVSTFGDDFDTQRHQCGCEDDPEEVGNLSWVVVGHEQGPGKRDVPIQYSGAVASQCARAGVPCFFKKDSAGKFPANMPRQFPAWMEV